MKHSSLLVTLLLSLSVSPILSDDSPPSPSLEFRNLQADDSPLPTTYGMVNSDGLRVRSEPGLGGEILGKMSSGDIVNVLGETGSNVIVNGVWDYWYKIVESRGKEHWVNALYITNGPFTANFSTKEVHSYDDSQCLLKGSYKTSSVQTFVPLQILKQSTQRYRSTVTGKLDYYYVVKSYSSFVAEVNNKIVHGSELSIVLGASHRQIDFTDFPMSVQMPRTRKELIEMFGTPVSEDKNGFKHPSSDEVLAYVYKYTYKGLIIEFKEYIGEREIEYVGLTISSNTIPIKYGLQVGVPVSYVKEFLGDSQKGTKDKLIYLHDYEAVGYQIEFQCKDSKVIGIKWEQLFYL